MRGIGIITNAADSVYATTELNNKAYTHTKLKLNVLLIRFLCVSEITNSKTSWQNGN